MTPALRRAAFGAAFTDRVASEILDVCQACGACVEACPMTEPGGVDTGDAPGVVCWIYCVAASARQSLGGGRKFAPVAASASQPADTESVLVS